jgi:hypothetical protein
MQLYQFTCWLSCIFIVISINYVVIRWRGLFVILGYEAAFEGSLKVGLGEGDKGIITHRRVRGIEEKSQRIWKYRSDHQDQRSREKSQIGSLIKRKTKKTTSK